MKTGILSFVTGLDNLGSRWDMWFQENNSVKCGTVNNETLSGNCSYTCTQVILTDNVYIVCTGTYKAEEAKNVYLRFFEYYSLSAKSTGWFDNINQKTVNKFTI